MTSAISARVVHSNRRSNPPLASVQVGTKLSGAKRAKAPSLREAIRTIGEARRLANGAAVKHARYTSGDLYAALTYYKLARVSPRAADEFRSRLPLALQKGARGSRPINMAQASERIALGLVREGFITASTRREIHTFAEDRAALVLSRRRLGDGTVSGAQAAEILRERLGSVLPDRAGNSGQASSAIPFGPPSPKGPSVTVSAPSGFLWKPISDSDGMLAILLPEAWSTDASGVQILSPDGTAVLATGRWAGIGNGDRAHFRFDRSGGSFPAGAIVRVTFRDGSVRTVTIPKPTIRNEGGGA